MFNGVKTEAILDTGASISVVSKQLVDAMDVKVDPSKGGMLKLADNSSVKPHGVTETFTVEVEESKASINALVLPSTDTPVFLGMDWFHATGAMIYPKDKILKFNSAFEARSLELESLDWDIFRDIGFEAAEAFTLHQVESPQQNHVKAQNKKKKKKRNKAKDGQTGASEQDEPNKTTKNNESI